MHSSRSARGQLMQRSWSRLARTGRGKLLRGRAALRIAQCLAWFAPVFVAVADEPASPVYQTGFEEYRPFDPGVMTLPWRQANDSVRGLGDPTSLGEDRQESTQLQQANPHSGHRH